MHFVPPANRYGTQKQDSEFLSRHYHPDCKKYNPKIHAKRTRLQIIQIHMQTTQHFFHRIGVSVFQRSFRCQTGTHKIYIFIILIMTHDFIYKILPLRPRAHNTHISFEHIPKLRQFVKMTLAEEFAVAREFSIIFRSEARSFTLGLNKESAELIYIERLSAEAYPFLPENHAAFVFEPEAY